MRPAVRGVWGILLTLWIAGCSERPPPASVRSDPFWVMGTAAGVALPASDADRLDAAAAVVEAVFYQTDRRLSLYRDDSELRQVNRHAGIAPVTVSEETVATVDLALRYARQTESAFDPTVAPLVGLWQSASTGGVPAVDAVARALSLTGYAQVQTDPAQRTVYLPLDGMQLDLGGIAKGTAVDRAATALRSAGFDRFLIDLGGDIWGEGSPDGQPAWRVGVRHPFIRGEILGIVRVPPGSAIVTSGQYERFIEIDGERYGHVIDPRTGYPVRGMAGVTVIAGETGSADALSTALFVLGLNEAPTVLKRFAGVEAILIPDRQPVEIWLTPGIVAQFEPSPRYRKKTRQLTITRDP